MNMTLRFPKAISWSTCGAFASNFAAIAGLSLIAACTAGQPGAEINDPYEAQNRKVHNMNVALDRVVFGPRTSESDLPRPLTKAAANFTANLGRPSAALNSLLQGRPEPLVANTFRFLINSTVGIGGIFDPATGIGIPEQDTDFGETLHVWGVGEGAFLMVPIAGPTTQRDLAGSVVDLILDPVGSVLNSPEQEYVLGIKTFSAAGSRVTYSSTINDILYNSADSYAQLRLYYLQNRHFELGEEAAVIDPYEDPYGQ